MTRPDWEVMVAEDGRSGTVTYREPSGTLQFYWEFGGGDAVAIISIGTAASWAERHAWAAPRRDEIIQRVIDEVIRQRAPRCSGVLDEKGWVTLYEKGTRSPSGSSPPPSTKPPPSPSAAAGKATQHLSVSARRARIVSIFAVAILALSVVAWLGRSALQIKTTGAPWGSSMRAGNTVITLITRLEPYVPTLNRNAGNDRYTVGLLLHDAADGARRYVELARGRAPNDLSNTKLLARQGTRVWVQVPESMMYDVASGRLVGTEELQRDPSLTPPERRFSMTDLAVGDRAMTMYLSAGGQVSGARWLGIHAPTDINSSFREGFRAPVAADFDRSAEARRLYAGSLTVDGSVARFASLQPTGADSLFNGALVRAARNGGLLELAGGGWLMVHESKARRAGAVVVSRVDAAGTVSWQVETGIGELLDVLPDAEWPAFVGQRPRVPDKVSEPILVVVDAKSGRVRTWSLWMTE